jgi:hypothetical protein
METAEDQPFLERAFTRFRSSHFRFQELIIAIALGDVESAVTTAAR